MIASITQDELNTWSAPGCTIAVAYAPAVLERIRRAVTEAFYSLPHGGLEIGGVLYGKRTPDSVAILAFRPLDCEHAHGPSFTLSAADEQNLEELIAAPLSEPELHGMEALGWYHSHTRSGVALSVADVTVHTGHFPEPWQVALVIQPLVGRPPRAGFFLRDTDGDMRGGASPAEFTLSPVRLPPGIEDDLEPTEPEEAPGSPPAETVSAISTPRTAVPRTWHSPVVGALAIVAGLLAGAGFWAAKSVNSTAQVREPLSLTSTERGGQLDIRWNGATPAVAAAATARLEILDGTRRRTVNLDPMHLRKGSFAFVRESERVDIRMLIEQHDGERVEEITSFLGPKPVRSPTPEELDLRRERDALAVQSEQLRDGLRAESQRRRRLEGVVRSLRTQLEEEHAARLEE